MTDYHITVTDARAQSTDGTLPRGPYDAVCRVTEGTLHVELTPARPPPPTVLPLRDVAALMLMAIGTVVATGLALRLVFG